MKTSKAHRMQMNDTIHNIPDIKNKAEHLLDKLKYDMTQIDY